MNFSQQMEQSDILVGGPRVEAADRFNFTGKRSSAGAGADASASASASLYAKNVSGFGIVHNDAV